MTPDDREKFDLEIYLETKNHRGCIVDAADYLRHKNPDRVSRLVNPYDSRANTIFGETAELLEAFNDKHPELAVKIWRKLSLQVRPFLEASNETVELDEFAEAADATAREQSDVTRAVMLKKPIEIIQKEAHEAFEKARRQYDLAMKLGQNEK